MNFYQGVKITKTALIIRI